MSRKDVFHLMGAMVRPAAAQLQTAPRETSPAQQNDLAPASDDVERPLLNLARPTASVQSAALGAISQSLEAAGEKARRADELEQMLAKGRSVVEIDPVHVDPAPIPDRMPVDEASRAAFIATIREQGQQTPIMVRPKPGEPGRYQVAFGHRRLDAARALGRPVFAIVRQMSDEELALAQGQENSARADLSFIERARFAARLEEAKFSRDVIMAALGVDKSMLSRMLMIIARTPREVVEAIGPAPSAGRPRWVAFVDLLDGEKSNGHSARDQAIAAVRKPEFATLTTDERFEVLFVELSPIATRASGEPLLAKDGARIGKIIRGSRRQTLSFDDKATPEFGEFVIARVAALYEEFRTGRSGPKSAAASKSRASGSGNKTGATVSEIETE